MPLTELDIIHYLSIILPFANETAIVLTHSKLPIFSELYRLCIDDALLKGFKVVKGLNEKVCTKQDHINKILIDLLAYFGIMLFIGKNTIQFGYITGVTTGLVLIFCSIMLPNMFLGMSIGKITNFFNIKNSYLFILIGISLIIGLMYFTTVMESITQNLTKGIKKIDPVEKNVKN